MAYDGGVKYMDVPFEKAWWDERLTSPFERTALNVPKGRKGGELSLEILTYVERFVVDRYDEGMRMILDEAGREFTAPIECVIIGSKKESDPEGRLLHYILLVTRLPEDGIDVYERVGVGTLLQGRNSRVSSTRTSIRIR
jgi:hypothetical protein